MFRRTSSSSPFTLTCGATGGARNRATAAEEAAPGWTAQAATWAKAEVSTANKVPWEFEETSAAIASRPEGSALRTACSKSTVAGTVTVRTRLDPTRKRASSMRLVRSIEDPATAKQQRATAMAMMTDWRMMPDWRATRCSPRETATRGEKRVNLARPRQANGTARAATTPTARAMRPGARAARGCELRLAADAGGRDLDDRGEGEGDDRGVYSEQERHRDPRAARPRTTRRARKGAARSRHRGHEGQQRGGHGGGEAQRVEGDRRSREQVRPCRRQCDHPSEHGSDGCCDDDEHERFSQCDSPQRARGQPT